MCDAYLSYKAVVRVPPPPIPVSKPDSGCGLLLLVVVESGPISANRHRQQCGREDLGAVLYGLSKKVSVESWNAQARVSRDSIEYDVVNSSVGRRKIGNAKLVP